MTVYLPKGAKSWYFNFTWRGQRHCASTHQLRKEDAALVEAREKLRLRQEFAGIAPFDPARTPTFQDWAGTYVASQERFVGRADVIERTLSILLEFWGRPRQTPKRQPTGTNTRRVPAPYHDLRLGHPIADPTWIVRFDEWVSAKGVSGSTRNSYLSALSGMYRLARQPEYRTLTNVTLNPFAEIRRSPPNSRVVALTPEQVRAWIAAAPRHIRIAMAIAALAPKLRLQTILSLEWAVHLDRGLTQITIEHHKTRRRTQLAQVTPIDPQLREILEALRADRAGRYVVPSYHGRGVKQPLKSITKGIRRAAEATGLTWGVATGVTFHTLRHSIATLLARLGVGERLRMEIMGHREIRTTQQYTHLVAADQVAPHAVLSAALSIKETVLAAPRPVLRKVSQPRSRTRGKSQGKQRVAVARIPQRSKA